MGMKDLEPFADVSAGDRIAEALPGLLGTVASVVPRAPSGAWDDREVQGKPDKIH
jgi:hypothetical protein